LDEADALYAWVALIALYEAIKGVCAIVILGHQSLRSSGEWRWARDCGGLRWIRSVAKGLNLEKYGYVHGRLLAADFAVFGWGKVVPSGRCRLGHNAQKLAF